MMQPFLVSGTPDLRGVQAVGTCPIRRLTVTASRPPTSVLRVLCGSQKLNAEFAEILRDLCVNGFEGQRARRISPWFPPRRVVARSTLDEP